MENTKPLLKIAHISDLHFSKPTFNLRQLFSKRWIGNLNLLFNRSKTYLNKQPFTLLDTFKKQNITHVLISGDLSTTSSQEEFEMAQEFIEALKQAHMHVYMVPGNHDSYTKSSYKKELFYQYFCHDQEGLQKERVSSIKLEDNWWLVTIDSTYPTAVYYSTGHYTQKHDSHLRDLLSKIPSTDSVIVMNHFPLFHHEHPRRIMHGAEMLRETLSLYPFVKFYLHGHTHRHCVADLRGNHLPIILDSGSASHVRRGSWNCIALHPSHCVIDVFIAHQKRFWNLEKTVSYKW